MAPRVNDEHRLPPGKRELETSLGKTSALWARVREDLASEFGPLEEKWSFSAKTQRWSLQLKHPKKKRTVLYLIVCARHFVAAFALGEKACAAARTSGLPPTVLAAIEAAPRYAEGRGLWLEVRARKDAANVLELATLKMAH